MKEVGVTLHISFTSALLACIASGPVSAASFELADDIRLENVSTLQQIDKSFSVQANYIAQQPDFLAPFSSTRDAESDVESATFIELWLASAQTIRFSAKSADLGMVDNSDPRIYWVEQDATKVSFPNSTDKPALEPTPLVELSWESHFKGAENGILTPFLVREEDTTCGFPNGMLGIVSVSAQIGLDWAMTASWAAADQSPARLNDVTWLQVSKPEIETEFESVDLDGFNAPWAFLQYQGLSHSDLASQSGFYKQPEIFKCRTFASALDVKYIVPFDGAFFANASASDFNPFTGPLEPATVPLPGSGGTLLAALLGLATIRRSKRKAA